MARYFIDFEFIEGFKKPWFGKRRHFIDMISIGIVAEDGREFYAISNEYKWDDADDWVKENVIMPMYGQEISGDNRNRFDPETFHKRIGKSNVDIRSQLYQFITAPVGERVEFYGYYSDYDWVLFCSLFGRMLDLPEGFPMYCNDLKQMLDEKVVRFFSQVHPSNDYFEERLEAMKDHPGYPKQLNEHNALADARWNKKLFEFLQTV